MSLMTVNEPDSKPWVEFVEVMTSRFIFFMLSTAIIVLWACNSLCIGPVFVALLLKPMSLASQSIDMLEDGV